MKLIEAQHKSEGQVRLQKIFRALKKLLTGEKTDENPEEIILTNFLRGLDNRFVMLRNLKLESTKTPFPPILVGPTGMAVLNLSREKGFYKAKEDSWWKMDRTTQRFNPGRPNLIKQSQEYAQSLSTILDTQGKSHPAIIPLLIFADPGAYIETTNPAVRIVHMDGVDNLISDFLYSEEVLQVDQVDSLVNSLETIVNPEKTKPKADEKDIFGQDLVAPEKKALPKFPAVAIPTEMHLPVVDEKLKFTRKQWVVLAILLILTIVVLLVAIVFALSIF